MLVLQVLLLAEARLMLVIHVLSDVPQGPGLRIRRGALVAIVVQQLPQALAQFHGMAPGYADVLHVEVLDLHERLHVVEAALNQRLRVLRQADALEELHDGVVLVQHDQGGTLRSGPRGVLQPRRVPGPSPRRNDAAGAAAGALVQERDLVQHRVRPLELLAGPDDRPTLGDLDEAALRPPLLEALPLQNCPGAAVVAEHPCARGGSERSGL
mmetsp:Transcript_62873/g.182387  ORF Transcript_62873/g.182387 Transcript_62873/m.182387 type:complete len:212 (-) Transcript_62873:25-660(-)